MNEVVAAFWWAFGAGAVAALPIYALLLKIRSRQTVSPYAPEGHQKKQGTPTMGGLIVLVAMGAAAIALGNARELAPLVGFAAIGFVDDFVVPRFLGKRGLGWKPKILLQIVAASGSVWLYGAPSIAAGAIGAFLILFYCNAFNFLDGLDGLAGSVGILFAAGLGVCAAILGDPSSIAIQCAAVVGGLAAFLILNAPPARVFMGDVGSLPIGAVLGLMVWRTSVHGTEIPIVPGAACAILSLVLVAELVPVPLQIASVKLRHKKLFSMTPIHHAFEAAGWPESRVVWSFALLQFVLSGVAVSLVVTR